MKNLLWWIGSMVAVILVLCVVIEVTEPDKSNSSAPAARPSGDPLPNFKVQ